MKAFFILPLALLVAACGNDAPSIDDLKEDSYPLVGWTDTPWTSTRMN